MLYCGKILHLKKGYQCSIHYHKVKDETFYILSGKVKMIVNDDIRVMHPGDAVHIPPQTNHRFIGIEDTDIIEISTHHEDDDSYRIKPSGKVGEKK